MSILVLGAKSNEPGGVENVVANLQVQLERQGFDVTTLHMPRLNHKLFWTLKPVWSIQPFLRSLSRKFDLVHGHGDNCLFYSLFRKKKIPYLVTSHGTQPLQLRSLGHGNRVERWYFSLPEIVAGKNCDIVVAVSRAAKAELIQYYGLPSEKIRVIHNGVDTKTFKPMDRDEAREKLGLAKEKKYGLWIGRTIVRKGLDAAIVACENAECDLLIRGTVGNNTKSVVSLGDIPPDKMPYVYNAADFLIHPSRYEAGPPLVCLEAMACGLPVIASENSKTGEVLTDGVEGFIVSNQNVQAYSRKISLIVSNPNLSREMSESARKTALAYDWEKQAQQYVSLYQELLS